MQKSSKIAKICAIIAIIMLNFAFFNNLNLFKFDSVLAEDNINAKAMAVIEKNSGRILFCKNENEKLPMASLTKIITAIYVIENVEDLDKEFLVVPEATKIEGTSIYLKAGEHLSVRELLYGLMLRSGNDAAVMLSIIASGSQEDFVMDVNAWLKSKGFDQTHIMNPHGLHHEDHYTTALDLAKITAYALNNPTFSEIVKTKETTISNELGKNKRFLKNKNRFLKEFEFADGVKTGFTKKAGRCFVGSSSKDDMQIICVLLNCVPMFEECLELTQKAFENLSQRELLSTDKFIAKFDIDEKTSVYGKVLNDFYYPLKDDELQDIKIVVHKNLDLKKPIKVGDELGTVEITFKNQLIFSDKIYSINNVNNNSVIDKVKLIIENM